MPRQKIHLRRSKYGKRFVAGRRVGEVRPPKVFKVFITEPTTWGFEEAGAKYFRDFNSANKYARSLLKDLKNAEEFDFVAIVDGSGNKIRVWRLEEKGKIEYYPEGV